MRASVWFVLQAALWVGLTLTFAALIEIANLAPWDEALSFSATNWLPWVALAPVVFWLARRFPLERGGLVRSIPVHTVACAVCCFAMLWIGAYFAPWPRGFRAGTGGSVPWERRDPISSGEVAGPPRDWRERAITRLAERLPRTPGEGDRVVMVLPPPTTSEDGPSETIEARNERVAGERPPGERPPGERPPGERAMGERKGGRPPGSYRGPGGGSASPTGSSMTRNVMTRFWPPFSGIVLRVNVSAAVYLIIACFAHAFSYYRRAQDRERESIALAAGLSRAKLDALRLQLQPHFLFNTLNAISTLVHRDANAADELIGDLSELLRLSLQTSDHEVPLSRELELLDCYLAIEQTRLGERLKIVREIDPQAQAALVPTFVLQPLAENAIRHGIEPRLAPGTLTIRADVVGGNVRLLVSDDGVGLKASSRPTARRGIGIVNTEERLRALHGDAAHLDIVAPETGGVQVQIVIPRRTTPAASAAKPTSSAASATDAPGAAGAAGARA